MPFFWVWLLHVKCLATELWTASPFTGREKAATHRGRRQPADAGRSPVGSRWGTAAAARSWKRSAQSQPGWSGKSPARRSRDAGTWGETGRGRGGEGWHGYRCGRMGDTAGRPQHTPVGSLAGGNVSQRYAAHARHPSIFSYQSIYYYYWSECEHMCVKKQRSFILLRKEKQKLKRSTAEVFGAETKGAQPIMWSWKPPLACCDSSVNALTHIKAFMFCHSNKSRW